MQEGKLFLVSLTEELPDICASFEAISSCSMTGNLLKGFELNLEHLLHSLLRPTSCLNEKEVVSVEWE